MPCLRDGCEGGLWRQGQWCKGEEHFFQKLRVAVGGALEEEGGEGKGAAADGERNRRHFVCVWVCV